MDPKKAICSFVFEDFFAANDDYDESNLFHRESESSDVKKLQNWTIDALAILVLTCACLLTCAICTIYLTVWNCEIFEKIKLYKISHTLKFEIFEKLSHTLKLWDIWKLFILYKIFHAEP